MGLFKSDEEKKEDYIKKGLELANKSEYEKAVKEFENALKLFPKDEDALFNLGFVYSDSQQYGPAYDIFKKLININPHHIEAFNNLGLIFARQGKYGDATFVYEKGVEHNPAAAVLYNNLGNVYYDTGKFEKALQMFKKAGELDPVFTERLYHLGIDSFIKGTGETMDDAITKLEQSAKLNVNKAKSSHDLGVAYIERHMEDKAIEAFNQAINIDPNYLSAYVNLGYAYQHKEEFPMAIKSFEKALILNPKSAKLYNTIGLIYDKMEQPDVAVKMYKKAVSLDPTYANSHYMLGQLYQNRGNVDKAVAEFTKHIRIHEAGNMVEDAMQRIADMKTMPLEEVKELFSLYIDPKPEGMSKPASPPPQMEKRDEKDYMKNIKEKMAEKKTVIPPAPVPQPQVNQPAAPSFRPAQAAPPAAAAAQPSQKAIDPNEYMKLMKEKMKKKMSGEPEPPKQASHAGFNLAPQPPIQQPPPQAIMPVAPVPQPPQQAAPKPQQAQPSFEVISEPSSGGIIDLPPRPADTGAWGNNDTPVVTLDTASYQQQKPAGAPPQPHFDSASYQLPPEAYMETIIKPVAGGTELPTDKMPEFKKQPHTRPIIQQQEAHGNAVSPISGVGPIAPAGQPVMAPRPNIPAHGAPKISHSAMPDYDKAPTAPPLKKDDDDDKPKVKHNFY